MLEILTNLLGEEITMNNWKYKLLSITESVEVYVKVLCSFTTDDFTFERELKFHESNFQTAEQYYAEIDRQLTKLNDYTNALAYLTNLAAENNATQFEYEDKWKWYITSIELLSPIEATATFRFYRLLNGKKSEFEKSAILLAETFQSMASYLMLFNSTLDQLNTPPPPIDVEYYSNLIKQEII